jgi:hypothetical protein
MSKRLTADLGKLSQAATNVVIYRDPSINRCRFVEVGDVAAAVLEKLLLCPTPYTELISFAVSISRETDPQQTIADFLGMIEHLQSIHIFLGNQRVSSNQ